VFSRSPFGPFPPTRAPYPLSFSRDPTLHPFHPSPFLPLRVLVYVVADFLPDVVGEGLGGEPRDDFRPRLDAEQLVVELLVLASRIPLALILGILHLNLLRMIRVA